jgi:hypothetical protein
MKLKTNDVIQLLTLTSVIVGIVLVMYELRQAQNLAKAQLTADSFQLMQQQQSSLMGEDPAEALSVACLSPSTLSHKQKLILFDYHQGLFNRVRRSIGIQANSGFSYFGDESYLRSNATFTLRLIGATEYGRWWLEQTIGGEPFASLWREAQNQGYFDCATAFDSYDERVAAFAP